MSSIAYQQDILEKFKQAFQNDGSYIEDWIVSWEYQERRKKRKVNYGEGLPEEFYTYDGPKDLGQWINWMLNVEKANFFESNDFKEWSKVSYSRDAKIFKNIDYKTDANRYFKGLGNYNSQDYFYANLIPHPSDTEQTRVLDFGAGFGRQSNLWTQLKSDTVYVGMDAIPKSYCLQHYFSFFTNG